jgi:NADH-quinone oxidoreductase subunit N
LWLAIAGLLSAVVAAYYYLRVVKLMYFDEPAPAFESPRDLGVGVIAATSAVAMFPVLFIFGGVLYSAAGAGASALF